MDKLYIDDPVALGSSLEGTQLTLVGMAKVGDISIVLSNKLISLEEDAIKDALISLGWTPPGSVAMPQFLDIWEMK